MTFMTLCSREQRETPWTEEHHDDDGGAVVVVVVVVDVWMSSVTH